MEIFACIVGFLWIGITFYRFNKRVRLERQRLSILAWPQVWGQIEEHELRSETRKRGKRRITYYTNTVRYTYHWNGDPYQGKQISPGHKQQTNEAEARALEHSFDRANSAAIYVNPNLPIETFLYPGTPQLHWRYLTLTALTGILMPLLLIWASWGLYVAQQHLPDILQFVNQ